MARTWVHRLFVAWLVLVVLSHLWQALAPARETPPRPNQLSLSLAAVEGETRTDARIALRYRDLAPSAPTGAVPVLMLHGSPGRASNFDALTAELQEQYRLLIPDLPGFGASTLALPDYSIRAHGDYVLQMLDALAVPRVHIVGFSMGSGPALHVFERAPERVASLTLLSAIGVQELEWLGEHRSNHALHGFQLLGLWCLEQLVPHFGTTDALQRGTNFARNFYDSDQRPLRGLLERFEPPMLIIHGEGDFLVPATAAREHARIVPQAETWIRPGSHFMVFRSPPPFTEALTDFLARADRGEAPRRDDAAAERRAAANTPFDPASIPPAEGAFLWLLVFLIAVATLVSEDLTCILAGLLASEGRITFVAAAGASFLGIFVGDMLLFLAGRLLGRPAVRRAPLRWFVTPGALERSSQWFQRRGMSVILASRFLPGTRLPTYLAAGVLGTSLPRFALWFGLAGLVWTPALVGLAMLGGRSVLHGFAWFEDHALVGLALVVLLVLLVTKVGVPLCSHRGRRLLWGAWLRKRRWEFWPPWLFYPPVLVWVAWLAIKHRSLSVVTAVNPGIPAGGFIGESKADILERLQDAGSALPATRLIPSDVPLEERCRLVETFVTEADLWYPIVLKPDAGQRGTGVEFPASGDEVRAALARAPVDMLAQQHVVGVEFGAFYYRIPGESRGRLFSITEKRLPIVVGDGARTLEQLILDDPRAPAMARTYLDNLAERLAEVPADGVPVRLARLGTHCQGAIFLDGEWARTEALEDAVDRISQAFAGFHFGRFDIRVPSAEDFQRGENLHVIELNGLTSESTNIYDPKYSLVDAYRVLFRQWSLAFRIGELNKRAGVRPASLGDVLRESLRFLKTERRRRQAGSAS